MLFLKFQVFPTKGYIKHFLEQILILVIQFLKQTCLLIGFHSMEISEM